MSFIKKLLSELQGYKGYSYEITKEDGKDVILGSRDGSKFYLALESWDIPEDMWGEKIEHAKVCIRMREDHGPRV